MATTKKTATKKLPTTKPAMAQNYLVFDPNCSCSSETVYAKTPLDAAKEFAELKEESLGTDIGKLHIIPLADLPMYEFIRCGVTMKRVTK